MLLERIKQKLKESMLLKDEKTLTVLRSVFSEIKNKEIELKSKGKELSDEMVMDVLRKEVKKRRDAEKIYSDSGRNELAENEKYEISIIEQFLPPQMSRNDIEKIVEEVISGIGEVTQKDIGKIIKEVLSKTKGNADGSVVSEIVKSKL